MKRLSWDTLDRWRKRSLGFKPNKGQMKRTPLRPISEKRARTLPARREAVEQAVEGKRCVGRLVIRIGETGTWNICEDMATVGHEPLLRSRGGDPTDPKQLVPLCQSCHGWVHANPKEASNRSATDGSGPLMLSQYNRGEKE